MIADQQSALEASLDALLDELTATAKPLIYTSGIGIYGDMGHFAPDVVLTEDDPVAPPRYYHFLPGVERRLRDAAGRGIRSVVVRPGLVYGRRGGWIGPIPRRFASARRHGRMLVVRAGRHRISHIDVDDLADLYLLALERGVAGSVYNATADEACVQDIATVVSALAGWGGEVDEVSVEEHRRLDGWTGPFDFQYGLRVSSARARDELGWTPTRPGVLDHLRSLHGRWALNEVYPDPMLTGTPQ